MWKVVEERSVDKGREAARDVGESWRSVGERSSEEVARRGSGCAELVAAAMVEERSSGGRRYGSCSWKRGLVFFLDELEGDSCSVSFSFPLPLSGVVVCLEGLMGAGVGLGIELSMSSR